MLIRVYELLSDNIGFEVFVDPWSMRDGVLDFDADKSWLVTPST